MNKFQCFSSTGVKIITQQVQPSKILPKPSSVALSSSSSSPIMVVSSNGAIMTTKLVTQPTGEPQRLKNQTKSSKYTHPQSITVYVLRAATQATYTRPTVSPIGARISASSGGTTYVKTTSGSIITVVPKSLATLGGKIISSNIVSGERLAPQPDPFIDTTCRDQMASSRSLSANRHDHEDHHHPHDLQAERHRGSENHRERSHHSGPPRQERGHHAVKRRGQSDGALLHVSVA